MRIGDLVKFSFQNSLGILVEKTWDETTDAPVWRVQWFYPITSTTSEYKEDLQKL